MKPTRLSDLFSAGEVATSAWISCDSPYAVEVLAHAGYDAVTVDCQHGMFGIDGAIGLLQAIAGSPAVAMARVPTLDPAVIGKVLDAGAWGVICPAVDTAQQCRDFVAACRYPPIGTRSYGPARGLLVGGPHYAAEADDLVLTWAMVESAASLEHLEEIVAVDGLDGVYVGPNDLALSLGEKPGGGIGPVVTEALRRIASAARESGRLAGVFCGDLADADTLIDMGYNFITPGNDVQLLRHAAGIHVRAVRGDHVSQSGD